MGAAPQSEQLPQPEQKDAVSATQPDVGATARAAVKGKYGDALDDAQQLDTVEQGKEGSKALCDFRADLMSKVKSVVVDQNDSEAVVQQKFQSAMKATLDSMPQAVKDVLKSRKSPQHLTTAETGKYYVDVVLMNDDSGKTDVKLYDKADKTKMKDVGDVKDGEAWLDFKAKNSSKIQRLSGDVDAVGQAVRKILDDADANGVTKGRMKDALPPAAPKENHLATVSINGENYDIWLDSHSKIVLKNYKGVRNEY